MPLSVVPKKWVSFLADVDAALTQDLTLHCLGGFVVEVLYDRPSHLPTSDVDIVEIVPQTAYNELMELAGEGSKLYKKHGLYFQMAGVAKLPENYADRLTTVFQGHFKHLHLYALDPYDIALSKLEYNRAKDRQDVSHLARTIPFDLDILKDRYEREQRHNMANPMGREDTTLQLWVDMITEERNELGSKET